MATAIRFPVAPEFKVDGMKQPPASGLVDSVAGFMGPLENFEPLTAVFKHLRHEREGFQLAVFIERRQDLFLCSDGDPISCSQFQLRNSSSEIRSIARSPAGLA